MQAEGIQVEVSREDKYWDVCRAAAAALDLRHPERLRFTHHNHYQDVRLMASYVWVLQACALSS